MEIITLEEMLDSLREGMETELDSEGLASWTINTAGVNFVDNLEYYSLEDLRDLRDEIREGSRVEVVIDLSEYLLDSVNNIISEHETRERDQDLEDYGDFEDDDFEPEE